MLMERFCTLARDTELRYVGSLEGISVVRAASNRANDALQHGPAETEARSGVRGPRREEYRGLGFRVQVGF